VIKAKIYAPLLREMDSELVKNVTWDVSFNDLKIKKWVYEDKCSEFESLKVLYFSIIASCCKFDKIHDLAEFARITDFIEHKS